MIKWKIVTEPVTEPATGICERNPRPKLENRNCHGKLTGNIELRQKRMKLKVSRF